MSAPVTPRENFLTLARGGTPAWVPFTLDVGASEGFTSSIQREFEQATGARDPAEYFDYDLRIASLSRRFGGADPRAGNPQAPADTVFDEWGIGHWAGGAEDTYEQMFPPLASAEGPQAVLAWPAPAVEDGGATERTRRLHERGYPVVGYAGSVYEWSWWLRGMEQFMMDLLTAQEMARAIVRKVSDFTLRLAMATADAGVDVLAFYDDAGSQYGMQISPETWRAFIKPAWRRILDAVRQRHPDTIFFLHSCGNITEIVPDVVELGFHLLHPVQPECMDAMALKRAWGTRITFCATLGAQGTLSRSTPQEVRRETTRIMDVLAGDGRALVCPSNRIQPETPWQNVLAFVRAARAHRKGRGTRAFRPRDGGSGLFP